MPRLTTELVGACDAFRSFLERLERVAASDASALVSGEVGSGKTVAARALHELGPRSAGRLVEIHLAALSATLVESELFGHEKGAFTGAHRERAGCFRRADGGTLVLDDVGLLPLEAQVKLLRVLQERRVEPLGAEVSHPIDVRVVATTSLDLSEEVRAGRFREDLYYRLAVVPLELPPLRARAADLPALARHLVARLSERLCAPARALSEGALRRLGEHPWPGNVRELENALERVLVLTPDGAGGEPGPIDSEELAFLDEATDGLPRALARQALAVGLTVDELARALMEEALSEQKGNVSAAARQVGLTRRAFEYRLGRPEAAADRAARGNGSEEDDR